MDGLAENDHYTEIWQVEGATDHYVWSMMRKRGVDEELITGDATNREKWTAMAEIFPEIAGNPTYEWVHLDLQRRFGIDTPISAATADEIWVETKAQLQESDMRPQALLGEMNVEVVSSTDDPTSSLERHEQLAEDPDDVTVRPTRRPDTAMAIDAEGWSAYVDELGAATDTDVSDLDGFRAALETSHAYFDEPGCGASDHGVFEPVTGMVSDSRKLISFDSRFEMFRRSLANSVGRMVERGQMPEDVAVDLVQRVAYDRPKDRWID